MARCDDRCRTPDAPLTNASALFSSGHASDRGGNVRATMCAKPAALQPYTPAFSLWSFRLRSTLPACGRTLVGCALRAWQSSCANVERRPARRACLPALSEGSLRGTQMALAGYTEILTWALVSRDENFAKLRRPDDGSTAVVLSNPATAEFEVCRTSLLPGQSAPPPGGASALSLVISLSDGWLTVRCCQLCDWANTCSSHYKLR